MLAMLSMVVWLLALPQTIRAEVSSDAPSPEAFDALALLESRDVYERKLGLLRLEALRELSTVATIRSYVDSRDPDMRADSLRALAAIEGEQSIPLLLERFKTDKHKRVRWSVLLALEPFQKRHPALLPVFIEALRDYRTEVRIVAVDIVSRIDDPTAREAIRRRYRKELRPDVRRVLHVAMKRLGSE